jgi:hypothetical protein
VIRLRRGCRLRTPSALAEEGEFGGAETEQADRTGLESEAAPVERMSPGERRGW